MKNLNGFIYLPSYAKARETIKKYNNLELVVKFDDAIINYAIYGEEPEFNDLILEMAWDLIIPTLQKSVSNYKSKIENGKKGGRPKKQESQPKEPEIKKPQQEEPKVKEIKVEEPKNNETSIETSNKGDFSEDKSKKVDKPTQKKDAVKTAISTFNENQSENIINDDDDEINEIFGNSIGNQTHNDDDDDDDDDDKKELYDRYHQLRDKMAQNDNIKDKMDKYIYDSLNRQNQKKHRKWADISAEYDEEKLKKIIEIIKNNQK